MFHTFWGRHDILKAEVAGSIFTGGINYLQFLPLATIQSKVLSFAFLIRNVPKIGQKLGNGVINSFSLRIRLYTGYSVNFNKNPNIYCYAFLYFFVIHLFKIHLFVPVTKFYYYILLPLETLITILLYSVMLVIWARY